MLFELSCPCSSCQNALAWTDHELTRLARGALWINLLNPAPVVGIIIICHRKRTFGKILAWWHDRKYENVPCVLNGDTKLLKSFIYLFIFFRRKRFSNAYHHTRFFVCIIIRLTIDAEVMRLFTSVYMIMDRKFATFTVDKLICSTFHLTDNLTRWCTRMTDIVECHQGAMS